MLSIDIVNYMIEFHGNEKNFRSEENHLLSRQEHMSFPVLKASVRIVGLYQHNEMGDYHYFFYINHFSQAHSNQTPLNWIWKQLEKIFQFYGVVKESLCMSHISRVVRIFNYIISSFMTASTPKKTFPIFESFFLVVSTSSEHFL